MAKASAKEGEKICNMFSAFMIGCVNGQIYKNCPKDIYEADAACDGIKSYIDKCGILYPKMLNV
jgi:hypothetical protein